MHDLQPIANATLPVTKAFQGSEGHVYGAYELCMRVVDSSSTARETKDIYYAVNLEGPPILLGYPWLKKQGAQTDYATDRWRYGVGTDALRLCQPKEFEKQLKKANYVFTVNYHRVEDTSPSKLPTEFAEFEDVFTYEDIANLPRPEGAEHAIPVMEGQKPPFRPLYNLSHTELDTLREYLDTALANGWIRPSESPAGAPILFVPKKDGTLRLCVDYRGLNDVTIKNRCPLPLISETLDRLSGAWYFSKLDLKDAYHRIPIKRGDEWKTAFRTRYGHFEYLVMPFGLTNAPATFQAYINKALAGLLDTCCVVYLDDILIYSPDRETHAEHVRAVLLRLRKHTLYANRKKCKFFTTKVEFLGFLVGTVGIEIDPSRVTAIAD